MSENNITCYFSGVAAISFCISGDVFDSVRARTLYALLDGSSVCDRFILCILFIYFVSVNLLHVSLESCTHQYFMLTMENMDFRLWRRADKLQ